MTKKQGGTTKIPNTRIKDKTFKTLQNGYNFKAKMLSF